MRAAVLLALLAAPAWAASGDFTGFDGTYVGSATPSTGAADVCAPFDLGRVTIDRGTLHSQPGAPIVSGFVTEDGLVRATMTRGSAYGAMDGRVKDGIISAGYADDRCAWTVELRPL